MAFQSIREIERICEEKQISFGEAVLLEDCSDRMVSREDSLEQMRTTWAAMLTAADTYEEGRRSRSGLAGGQGGQMARYRQESTPLCGDFMAQVIQQALEMSESNACMRRIVAAPTAGASGVLPAVLIPFYRQNALSEDRILECLYVAAGIGQVIAERAFIAGAAGGCQAEIGSASAMAAGAMVALKGGTPEQIGMAAAMALKNLLGLVCDPVAGLVEVPCIKRNVMGAMNAMAAADMALAHITSKIPVDQVIDAMREVGEKMDRTLKETGKGGLAVTEAGLLVQDRMNNL